MRIHRELWKLVVRTQKNKVLIVLVSLVAIFSNFDALLAAQIVVYCDKEVGKVNKKVFGNNLIGYDPMSYEDWAKEYYGYSDYGAGIWDPRLKRPCKEAIDLAKKSGMSMARFPGGCGTHHYDWKKVIGNNRKHFMFGLDEFLKTCEEIGVEPVITMRYFTGDEFDAADLVEYLNIPNDGKHKWALERAKNGHPEPYRVEYFEIGNEDWHGDHRKIKKVFPQEYARRYLKYYYKMKAVDPKVQIGAILDADDWNQAVLPIIKERIDFGIIHVYPRPNLNDDSIRGMDPKAIFEEILGQIVLWEGDKLSRVLKLAREKTHKDLPLAITEYNGGIEGDDPVSYRHSLGMALLNAELLKMFMKPGYRVLMANYWNFVNEHWGMISNGFGQDSDDLHDPYYKRPSYLVFQLYHEHFGDMLVNAEVDCASYKSGPWSVHFLSVNASKSKDDKKIYLMVINKNMKEEIASSIQFKDFKPMRAQAWVLNGPRIESTNEENQQEVGIKQADIKLGDQQDEFDFVFQPHSVTAIEIESRS